jgi:YVTN family beta-propeller protein
MSSPFPFRLACVAVLSLGLRGATPEESVPPRRTIQTSAHRGEHLQHPENSLQSIQASIDAGMDFVELDVRTTADGHLVLMHDATVNRMTNGKGPVSKMTLAEIKRLDLGARFPGKFPDCRVPTFDEALDLAKGRIGIYVDTKDATSEALVKAIDRHGMGQSVMFWSEKVPFLKSILALRPKWVVMPEAFNPAHVQKLLEELHPQVIGYDERDFNAATVDTAKQAGTGPFGLAISPSGRRIVTANGGPDRFSLTFLEQHNDLWTTRQLAIHPLKPDADDWKSTFMGLAFDGEDLLYASEGDSGQVRGIEPSTGRRVRRFDLNVNGALDSYSGDLAFDAVRKILYIVDQAHFRVAVFDVKTGVMLASVPVGRLPFALALSSDQRRLYVTNLGMFSYRPMPGADAKRARETGLPFPAFGFPSRDAYGGAMRRNASGQSIVVPGLGDPNVVESNSLCVIDVADPVHARVVKFVRTGLPFGKASLGGSSPSGVVATQDRIYVSNANNDSISVIDAQSLEVSKELPLRIAGLERLRGVMPIGLAYHAGRKQLFIAEAGINAIGVVDTETLKLLGHIPAGWFPTRPALFGDTLYVSNAKGHGIGPNATLSGPLPNSFQLERRKGSLSRYQLPGVAALPALSQTMLANNGFVPLTDAPPMPPQIKHIVIIVKENRTFDEVFGDLAGAPQLARYGRSITPNHHAMADRWAISSNFYADSEVSADGHHWLVGSYPNAWTESTMMAAYGDAKQFRLTAEAPGRLSFAESNSSVHPEDQLEAGTLWHHLERGHISFRNFGEGFELAGVDEGVGLQPTGERVLTNMPMPDPLYRNTSRDYPNYNTNIPDQFRATQFVKEIDRLYRKPSKPLPQLLFIHLPDDHTADPRPEDGYPVRASYVADNDYALGRIVEYLSHSPWWKDMAIFVTEDDAGGGVDHVDAHRTVMMVLSPYARKGYVARTNSSFTGMLKTVFQALGLPPLNLFDAAATTLSECFTNVPDFSPYNVLPANMQVFDPRKAREPMYPKPSPRMDDPEELRREHQTESPKTHPNNR